MMINAGVNAKNWLTKVYVMRDLFGTLVIVNVNDKSCDVGEYLDYENCKCRKKLVDKLTEECTENIDEIKIASGNKHKNKCSSCALYIVLFFHKHYDLHNQHWNCYLFCLLQMHKSY